MTWAKDKRQYRISTHALTWRATSVPVRCRRRSMNFYPRPHMEGDGLDGRLR